MLKHILRSLTACQADPTAYRMLCEKAGYLSKAFYLCYADGSRESLEHAVELVKQLEGIPNQTKINLLKKLKGYYEEGIDNILNSSRKIVLEDVYHQKVINGIEGEFKRKLNFLPSLAEELDIKEQMGY